MHLIEKRLFIVNNAIIRKQVKLMSQSKTKQCQNCKSEFIIDSADFEFYKKIDVPKPTWCPTCRAQRRLAFRSGRVLYKRKIEESGREVFSCISPKSPFKMFDADWWWSDRMDAMEYGKEYDFDRPFFEQIKELMIQIGMPHKFRLDAVDSPYSNNVGHIKNCYLAFNTGMSENCAYTMDVVGSHDSYDLVKAKDCELCYELFDCEKCYQVYFSTECRECSNVWFSRNLVNCQNCFGCVNLKHKKYHIFNKQYSPKEYEEKLKEFNLGSYQSITSFLKKSKENSLKFPNKFMHGIKNVNVTGDYLDNCKNMKESFLNSELEDCSYCQLILFMPSKDCYDMTVAGGELCCEIEESSGYQVKFCWFNLLKSLKDGVIGLYEMEYSIGNSDCHHLFGCVGLRHKKYCIFNKQYTKEEYKELVPKIKKHMDETPYIDRKGRVYKYGEFFPAELSPFSYNETMANEYFPLSEKQAINQGFSWYDKPKAEYKPTIKASDLSDDIKDIDDAILKEIIECGNKDCHGTGAFRLIPREFKFYQKQNIPIPRLCPECRHQKRIKQRNPWKLWQRQCQCVGHQSDNKVYQNATEHPHHKDKPCPNKFQTTYASDRKEIVYCEQCYNKEIS